MLRGFRHIQRTALLHRSLRHSSQACNAAAPPASEQKPSRGVKKREAQRMVELATQLCASTRKQLSNLQSADMLGEELYDAISLAQNIPKTNQARRRQVNFIAKLIRQMEEEDQQRVQDIAKRLQKKSDMDLEPGAADLAENWLSGLLCGDKGVMDKINSMPPHWHDLQSTRQLARRCRQLTSASEADSEKSEESGAPSPSPAFAKAEKQLRKDLQLLAAKYLSEREAEE